MHDLAQHRAHLVQPLGMPAWTFHSTTIPRAMHYGTPNMQHSEPDVQRGYVSAMSPHTRYIVPHTKPSPHASINPLHTLAPIHTTCRRRSMARLHFLPPMIPPPRPRASWLSSAQFHLAARSPRLPCAANMTRTNRMPRNRAALPFRRRHLNCLLARHEHPRPSRAHLSARVG